MSELLARIEPTPTVPFAGNGVTVTSAPPMARFSLRARKAADLEKLLGVSVPQKIGTMQSGVMCLGPDEWLMLAPHGTKIADGAGLSLAVTEVSDRNVAILLEGPRAASVLAAGCALDFDHFAIGRATRTIFETVEIIVVREAGERFHVEVWRSFAPWLWTAFVTVAAE